MCMHQVLFVREPPDGYQISGIHVTQEIEICPDVSLYKSLGKYRAYVRVCPKIDILYAHVR